MKYVFLINTIFQVIISIQILLNIGNNIDKYILPNTSYKLLSIIIIVCNIILIHRHPKIKYKVYYLISLFLASTWIVLFINTTINEHYKLLTPLLLLLSSIEIIRCRYILNE